MSLLWLYFLANMIIDILEVVILATEIEDSYIGLTFLAIGNSIAGRGRINSAVDIVAEISIAILGFTEMAMVGAFAGPIFLVLIGLSSSILPRALTQSIHHKSQ
jgi:Ca2+/Na+ antiporter